MPWTHDPSVNQFEGKDCWRTWFLLECEEHRLFGATQKHLALITRYGHGIEPYRAGTKLFLEDAPYFHQAQDYHRVCGPYEVFSISQLPDDSERYFPKEGDVIVYKEAHPERGPWLDRALNRRIEGIDVRHRQMASKFGYFPYRFSIKRAKDWKVRRFKHVHGCVLCKR
jgi:hypothetical protein